MSEHSKPLDEMIRDELIAELQARKVSLPSPTKLAKKDDEYVRNLLRRVIAQDQVLPVLADPTDTTAETTKNEEPTMTTNAVETAVTAPIAPIAPIAPVSEAPKGVSLDKTPETAPEAQQTGETAPEATPVKGEAVEQPKLRNNSIVPARYKERYGKFGHCGDDMAERFKAYCQGPKGECLPERLQEIADQNGAEVQAAYARWAHLNLGQKRMNLGNVLRGKLKRGDNVYIGSWAALDQGGEEVA